MPIADMALQIPLTRTPEQLDAILLSGAGSLVDTPYPILLLALALREKTAVLSLYRNQLQKEIAFDEGFAVDCQSNIATETFGRFLVSSGKLSEQSCRDAVALAASRGVPLEEILVSEKLISPTDLDRMLQQSLGRKLLEPFSWKSGTFEIELGAPPPDTALRVKVSQLVLTGVMKVETQEHIDEVIAPAREQFLTIASEPLFDLSDIRLSSEQQKVIEAARRGARLADVAGDTGIETDDVHRIVYALILLGAVTLDALRTEAPQDTLSLDEPQVPAAPFFELDHPFLKTTTEAPLPAPPSSLPPLPPLELEQAAPPQRPESAKPGVDPATADELAAAFLSHRRKDAFELLEVAETDGPLRFIRAFLGMADRYLPSRFDEASRDKAQEVFLAAARAYAELADPARREALIASRSKKRDSEDSAETTLIVPVPTREPSPPPPAIEKPPVEKPVVARPAAPPAERRTMKRVLIDPEELCKNGRELVEAGKLREALSSFEMAAECDTQNGTYAAEVAWCRFRLQVSPAPNTLKMLKNAIRIDPRSGLAHLYAGKVATTLGNRTEASAFLNRAAMLMPRDLRVVEALKALR